MQLFYNDSLYPQVQEVTFDKEESNHIHKVLRKKPEIYSSSPMAEDTCMKHKYNILQTKNALPISSLIASPLPQLTIYI